MAVAVWLASIYQRFHLADVKCHLEHAWARKDAKIVSIFCYPSRLKLEHGPSIHCLWPTGRTDWRERLGKISPVCSMGQTSISWPLAISSISDQLARGIFVNLWTFQNALADISETGTDWKSVSYTHLSKGGVLHQIVDIVCGQGKQGFSTELPHPGIYVKWMGQCICNITSQIMQVCNSFYGKHLIPYLFPTSMLQKNPEQCQTWAERTWCLGTKRRFL